MTVLYKGKWGLDSEGHFREDPWYLVLDHVAVQFGFRSQSGGYPSGYPERIIDDGVILPGLVNAHTHLQFSWCKIHPGGFPNVHEFAKSILSGEEPPLEVQIASAREKMRHAREYGTFFFADISNSAAFSTEIACAPEFRGIRFLELLGFSQSREQTRIKLAENAIKMDPQIHLTGHSVYGSSPGILSWVVGHEAQIASIHLLEEAGESGLPFERDATYEFLREIQQYTRYPELYERDLAEYLGGYLAHLPRLLLVHLVHADKTFMENLSRLFRKSAVVLCHRSNEYLGQFRKNWKILETMDLPLLLGTDSCASAPDLSVLHEIQEIQSRDFLPANVLWRAATVNAWRYFQQDRVPLFLFTGADTEPGSLIANKARYLFELETNQ